MAHAKQAPRRHTAVRRMVALSTALVRTIAASKGPVHSRVRAHAIAHKVSPVSTVAARVVR